MKCSIQDLPDSPWQEMDTWRLWHNESVGGWKTARCGYIWQMTIGKLIDHAMSNLMWWNDRYYFNLTHEKDHISVWQPWPNCLTCAKLEGTDEICIKYDGTERVMRILALEDPTDTTMDILRGKMFDKIFEVMRDAWRQHQHQTTWPHNFYLTMTTRP